MNSRRSRSLTAGRVAVSCLLCLGFWQFGQGAYIPAKAWVAQELMQRAWRKAEDGSTAQAPWPWADTWPVARLSARGGDIELIVLEGGSGRTLAFGPGHLAVSVLPWAGKSKRDGAPRVCAACGACRARDAVPLHDNRGGTSAT